MTSRISIEQLVAFYESKTHAILQRYGPGPRVHYHTGLVDEPERLEASPQALSKQIITAQERTLRHAADMWHAPSTLCEDVLDVGCGLGGGALFWAQEFGARVTAVTIVPSHIEWVARFAAQAGVGSRVRPLLCDALKVPGESCFDAAVAVDSSCYLPRTALFRRLAALLRPGGHVFIADCFWEHSEYEELFSRHWHAAIGTIGEYLIAAREAGLHEELVEDLSRHAAHFWTMTLALMQAEARDKRPGLEESAQFEASLRVHTLVRQGLANGGLRYALLSFSKAQ